MNTFFVESIMFSMKEVGVLEEKIDIREMKYGEWDSLSITPKKEGRWTQFYDKNTDKPINTITAIDYKKKYKPPRRSVSVQGRNIPNDVDSDVDSYASLRKSITSYTPALYSTVGPNFTTRFEKKPERRVSSQQSRRISTRESPRAQKHVKKPNIKPEEVKDTTLHTCSINDIAIPQAKPILHKNRGARNSFPFRVSLSYLEQLNESKAVHHSIKVNLRHSPREMGNLISTESSSYSALSSWET